MDSPKKSLVRNTKAPTPATKAERAANQEIVIKPMASRENMKKSEKSSRLNTAHSTKTSAKSHHDLCTPAVNSSKNMRAQMHELKENAPKGSARSDGHTPFISELVCIKLHHFFLPSQLHQTSELSDHTKYEFSTQQSYFQGFNPFG